MGNTSEEISGINRIDIESFFRGLSGKIETKSLELVAAALAESTTERGARRVLSYSKVDPSRLLQERLRMRKFEGEKKD